MLHTSANRSRLSRSVRLTVAVVALSLLLPIAAIQAPAQDQARGSSGAPRGWYLAGSKPADYSTGVDPNSTYQGHRSAYLRAKPSATEGFGTLMQNFSAAQYTGKRVRFSAWVKSEGVTNWAGLWMRVDKGSEMVAFDNMQNRPIKGTTDWRHFQVVLDVPADATGVFFGILLERSGTVWLSDVKFEIVGTDVPITGTLPSTPAPLGPANLSFEN